MATPIALRPQVEEVKFDRLTNSEIVVKDKRVFAQRINVDCSGMKCVTFFGLDGRRLTVTQVGDAKCGDYYVRYPCEEPWLISLEGCSRIFTKPGLFEIRDSEGEELPEGLYLEKVTVTPQWAAVLLTQGCK